MVVLGDFNAESNGMLKTTQILKDWSDLPTSHEQGSFISKMEWAPFKCLLWNDNILTVKLMVSVTIGVFCDIGLVIKNMLNYDSDNKCWKLKTV